MNADFSFGRFELRPATRELLENGYPVELGGRAFDVLHALITHRDRVLTKEELLDLAWPGLVVEENNLQVQISTLRKILGPQAIVTAPRRGYRFALASDNRQTGPQRAAPAFERFELFGRADELSAACGLVAQYPLTTIVGPAGIGKTRLAEAAGEHLHDRFPECVLVELASLADPDLVVVTIARALGLAVGDAGSALDAAARTLAGRRLLVVLDNCEHLLEAVVAVIIALRKGAPDLHILATSQEVMKHPDEHVYRLGALAIPAETVVSSAADAGATRLFVARAQAADSRFALDDTTVGAVVEICRHLDGIPLAIELAAARVPLLGVDGVCERLDERFRLLTAGSRLALPRHQTLRAALEWSYSLLSPTEQSIFDQLGAFAGSFSLESAQQLAANEQMDPWTVLEHLGALVDKSLLTVDAGAKARYRLLETTRAFALERLAARGIAAQTMRRHAEVMLALFERLYRDFVQQGVPTAKMAAMIAPDLDNLRSALRWASEPGGDRRIGIALVGASVARQYYHHHVVLKAWHWIDRFRRQVDESIPAEVAARFWLACADHANVRSPPTAIDDAKRAIALYDRLGDRLGRCQAWNALAYALMQTGLLDEAASAMDEVLRLRDAGWPPWERALVDNLAALVFDQPATVDRAREHGLAYLEVSRQLDSPTNVWEAQVILVDIDVTANRIESAVERARALLERHRASPEPTEEGRGLRVLAVALLSGGRLDEADAAFRESASLLRRHCGTASLALHDTAMLLALRGRVDDAARIHGYAERAMAERQWHPRYVSRRLAENLRALLAVERSADVITRLYDEGRALADDEAVRLAFARAV